MVISEAEVEGAEIIAEEEGMSRAGLIILRVGLEIIWVGDIGALPLSKEIGAGTRGVCTKVPKRSLRGTSSVSLGFLTRVMKGYSSSSSIVATASAFCSSSDSRPRVEGLGLARRVRSHSSPRLFTKDLVIVVFLYMKAGRRASAETQELSTIIEETY